MVRPVRSFTGRTHPLLGGMNSEGVRMMGVAMPGPDYEMLRQVSDETS